MLDLYTNFSRPKRSTSSSHIRLLHAVPGAPNVDVYANNNLVANSLAYRQFTQYLLLPPGSYNVRVFAAGTTSNPLIAGNINLNEGEIYTAAVIGTPSAPELSTVNDVRQPIPPVGSNLRLVHFSPDAPPVDLYLPSGATLFRSVPYKQSTNYIPVSAGVYTFYLRPSGSPGPVLYVPNIMIQSGKNYSIYVIGLAGGTPGLQVLIPLDGSTYIPRWY